MPASPLDVVHFSLVLVLRTSMLSPSSMHRQPTLALPSFDMVMIVKDDDVLNNIISMPVKQ